MSIELKISIALFLVGISNLFLQNNRNWVLGYRSPRAIKTHKSYAYANRIYGIGMILIGGFYLCLLTWFPRVFHQLTRGEHLILVIAYFAILFIIIEIGLRSVFDDK